MDKSNIPTSTSDKNAAQFISVNRNLVGFDNAGRSLYTTVKELVDNAMDSAESIKEPPSVEVTIVEMDKSMVNNLNGIEKHIPKSLDLSEVSQLQSTSKKATNLPQDLYYQITVIDNGTGIPHKDIPHMFGTVLSGTKYGNIQSRGKFGIGAKMALIWSKLSTGVPVEIYSSTDPEGKISFYRLEIDINSNCATSISRAEGDSISGAEGVLLDSVSGDEGMLLDNPQKWRGTKIVIVIKGNFTLHHKILQYFRHTAVICPYAKLKYKFSSKFRNKPFDIRYEGKSSSIPDIPKRAKYFPSDVNLDFIQGLIRHNKELTLLPFLLQEFEIRDSIAQNLIAKWNLDDNTELGKMTPTQVILINHMFKEAKFENPTGDCLSVTGNKIFSSGIQKQFRPRAVKAYSEGVYVVKGHPLKIDAAVCLGGRDFKEGLNIFRFANRSPLLFEASSDVIYKVAHTVNWKKYRLNTKTDKIGVFVNVVSTKIPFRGIGKEYVGGDVDSKMGIAVKTSLEACCKELLPQTEKMAREHADMEHKKIIETYNPHVAGAVSMILNDGVKLRAKGKEMTSLDVNDPCTRNFTDSETHRKLLEGVSSEIVTEKYLLGKLNSLLKKEKPHSISK